MFYHKPYNGGSVILDPTEIAAIIIPPPDDPVNKEAIIMLKSNPYQISTPVAVGEEIAMELGAMPWK
jgi:hypothetical protein